ncbi:MAG TPA: lipid A deacylase LpxR family protein, partial [Gemmatimonadaceae bacterium]|nr:lipid A deacylase LpxR family protein [Gemmatimonadaceae bacterium]
MRRMPMMALITVVAVSAPTSAHAQVLTRVDLDNDSFNFWQAPRRRADREYTQGTRINLLWPTASRLAQRLLGGSQQCGTDDDVRDCRMLSAAVTQGIYTPTLDPRRRTPDERPYAGWLGAEFGVQRDRADRLTALAFTIGVTGKASLAEPGQKAVHKLFGFRPPLGWEGQLPTEVAVMASYSGARQLPGLAHARSGTRLMIAPVWSARLGTVATDASAGLHMTVGLRPPRPWTTGAMRGDERWGVFMRAGATQRAVARNLFLDGTSFTTSASVEKNTFVGETE